MKCLNYISDQEYYIMMSFSLFSLGTYLIFIYFLLKKSILKDFCSRVLFYLSAIGALRSLFKCLQLPSTINDKAFCSIIAYFSAVTNFSSIIWSMSISVTLYQALINHEYNYFKHHSRWFVSSFIIAPLIFSLPFVTNSYSNYKGVCFFANDELSNIYGLILSTLPNILMFITGLLVYWRIWTKMKPYDDECTWNILFARGYIFIIITMLVLSPLVIINTLGLFIDICLSSQIYVFIECWISLNALGNVIGYLAYERVNVNIRRRSLQRPCNESTSKNLFEDS
jgi:hypothetical protein